MKGGMESSVLKVLSNEDIQKIHKASLKVLSEVGVEITEKSALDLCNEKGIKVDYSKNRVYFDEQTVLNAIKSAPSTVTIYSRDDDSKNIVLGGNRVYMGTGGTALNVLDFDRKRRPSKASDIAKAAKLVDKLDNVHFFVIPCFPNDVEQDNIDVNRFYHSMKNTTKPIMGGVFTEDGIDKVIDMAQKIAGGEDELRERPFVSFISSIISPLKLDDKYTRILFKIAKAGLPVATSCAPLAGATSPITLAGTVAQLNAEALVGVIMTQLVNQGTPILYSAVPTIMDMQTMTFLFGSVESGLMNAACAQMAQFYELPIYATGGISDSKLLDQQAGIEKVLTGLMPALAGANFIHEAAGQLDSGMTISYAQYVIDNDICGSVMRAVRGIEVDDKTLATEVIKRVSEGSDHLKEKLTVKKMRTEFYYPKTSTRLAYGIWEKEGKKDTWDLAEEVAKDILATHIPSSIDDNVNKEILNLYPGIKLD